MMMILTNRPSILTNLCMLNRFSLLYVQTLFYLTLLTLGLLTACILLRFVNGLKNGSSSSSSSSSSNI